MPLEGIARPDKEDTRRYRESGAWLGITLSVLLDRAAAAHPDREAIVEGKTRLTYSEFREKVDRLASGLAQLGIGRGDCVLLQLPNWAEFVYSYLALAKLGATSVLLLPRHRQLEISFFASLTKAKAWIVPEHHRNADFLPVIEEVTRSNPSLRTVITVRARETGFTRLEALLESNPPAGAFLNGPVPQRGSRCPPTWPL